MEGIGSQAAATFVHGHFIPFAADRFRDPANMYFHSCLRVRYPCEALVSDMIVHEGTFGGAKPEVGVFGEQSTDGPPPNAMSPADRLCQRETVRWVGRGSAVLHSPDFPRYAELLGWVFERLGWDPSRFDLFRCRIEYPVMPSTVRVSIAKPEASA